MAVLDTYNCSASCSCVKFFPVLSCCSFSLNSMILLLFVPCFHTSINYLNNLIEQDHRPIKRRNKFYQSLRTASTTIKGMEAIRGIYKKSRKCSEPQKLEFI